MPREAMPDVVVLLPGITGSALHRNGSMVWGWSGKNGLRALVDGGSRMSRDLMLHDDPRDRDDLDDGVVATKVIPDLHLIPGVWKIDGYTRVAESIRASFDVEPGRNYFEFPYDWRRDNRVSARRLERAAHDWLARWRETSGNQDARLILVAHSMGGLVSRYFLEVLGGWKSTRALLTFGTPYRGSLNALGTLANGERKLGGRVDLSALCRSFTSLYQLLPIYECWDAGDGTLRRVGESSGIPNVDAARAADALAFHREIEAAVERNRQDEQYRRAGYTLFPVVGTHQPTNQSARPGGDGVELLRSLGGRDRGGDGTVPRISATPIELERERGAMFAATKHGSLQNADATLTQLFGAFTGLYLDLGGFRRLEETEQERRMTHVGLDLEDVYEAGQPIPLAVEGDGGDPVSLVAAVRDAESGSEVARVPLSRDDDRRWRAELPPLPEGAYRVRVSGEEGAGAGIEPVEDAFVTYGEAVAR